MTTGQKGGLRADARRNRDQILAAAREMFTAQGPEVPMEEIARAARVGVGTLYRRFPDRESLIRAVAQESFTQVIDDARAACAEEATGWAALERLVRRSRRLQVSLRLAWSSVRAREILLGDPKCGELREALMTEIARIVEFAQAEGSMRRDVGAGDVAILLMLLLRQPLPASGPNERGLDRAIAIMLDGLRAAPTAGELPGRPITITDLRSHRARLDAMAARPPAADR